MVKLFGLHWGHSILGEEQHISTVMASQGANSGPTWNSSALSPYMHNSAVSVLLFHVLLLALASKSMLLSFHALRAEKHLKEDPSSIGCLHVKMHLLLLKCLIYNGHLGSLDLCTCKGKGNVLSLPMGCSDYPCSGEAWPCEACRIQGAAGAQAVALGIQLKRINAVKHRRAEEQAGQSIASLESGHGAMPSISAPAEVAMVF